MSMPQQPQTPPPFNTQDPTQNLASAPQGGLGIPTPPKKRRLPLILGAVGIFLFLCIGLVVIAAVVGGGSSSGETSAAANTPIATSVPAKAATTPTIAAATGKWVGPEKGKILFGGEFRTVKSGGFEILEPRATFKSGTELRMVVQFKEKAGATEIEIILSKVGANGSESVIDKAKVDLSSPDSNYYSNTLGTEDVAEGKYKVKYVRGATVLAEGQFTLAATAAQTR